MNADEYHKLALVTEHTPDFVRLLDAAGNPRDAEHNIMVARLLHALLGLTSEVGEFADALKRHIIYGAELDRLNLIEEHGDRSWYDNLFLAAVKADWEDSWTKNIAKLKARFGDRFTAIAALTRNLDAERAALAAATAPAHRAVPPGTRSAFTPWVPCRFCDDPICLTIRDLQEKLAAMEAAERSKGPCPKFRSAEDYRDHLPCVRCEPRSAS